MAAVTISDEYLTQIGSAIRLKNGSTDTYKPREMAAAIRALDASGDSDGGSGFVAFLEGASSVVIPANCKSIIRYESFNIQPQHNPVRHISVAEGSQLTDLGDDVFFLLRNSNEYPNPGIIIDLSNATQMTTLNGGAFFASCNNVEIILPSTIETVVNYFHVCNGPLTITFTGTPTTFPDNYLVYCYYNEDPNLDILDPTITINVPWSKDVYEPVVWTSSNSDYQPTVKINYNYVTE